MGPVVMIGWEFGAGTRRCVGGGVEPSQPADSDLAGAAPVLVAVWSHSVGSTWTVVLRRWEGGSARGPIVEWISSGVPVTEPEPVAMAGQLLVERGWSLFRDGSCAVSTDRRPSIGLVCRDGELIRLAHLVCEEATEVGMHPVGLAARWIAGGFTAEDAAGWICARVRFPPPSTIRHIRRSAPEPDGQTRGPWHDGQP